MGKQQYGIMPPWPRLICMVRGDAGAYPVYGVDWYEYKVLVGRFSGNEWIDIKRVKFIEKHEIAEGQPSNLPPSYET